MTAIASRSARRARSASGQPESGGGRRRRRARGSTRVERDSLGPLAVPRRALWGVFTERARHTFQLTGRAPHPALVRAYARIKRQLRSRSLERIGQALASGTDPLLEEWLAPETAAAAADVLRRPG